MTQPSGNTATPSMANGKTGMIRAAAWGALLAPTAVVAIALWGSAIAPRGELWASLSNGRAYAASFPRFPAPEALVPVVPAASTAGLVTWLGDLALYGAYRLGGETLIRLLHVALFVFCQALLGSRLVRPGRERWAVSLVLALTAVAYRELVAPGASMFVPALALASVPTLLSSRWIAVAAIGSVWANLHPSFLVLVPALAAAAALRRDPLGWRGPLAALAGTCIAPSGPLAYRAAWEAIAEGRFTSVHGWRAPRFLEWERAGELLVGVRFTPTPVSILVACLALLGVARLYKALRDDRSLVAGAVVALGAVTVASLSEAFGWALLAAAPVAALWVDDEVARRRAMPAKAKASPLTLALGALSLTAGIVHWGGGLHSQTAVAMPVKAAAFLVDAGLGGSVVTEPEWRGYLRFHVPTVTRVTSGRTAGLAILRSRADAATARAGDPRVTIYENNVAAISVSSTDSVSLGAAAAYFRAKEVPFNVTTGFTFGEAHGGAPTWANANLEAPDLGRRPEGWRTTEEALGDVAFFHARHADMLAIFRLAAARRLDRANVRLAIAMAEILASTGQWNDAAELLDVMDRVIVPRDAVPKLQALRFDVERELAMAKGRK